MKVTYLGMLADLEATNTYSLGGMARAYFYDLLKDTIIASYRSVAGYATVIQVCI